jgi:hypothetical protein
MTSYDWLRAYTALSRSGLITDEIRACEAAWGTTFFGDASAIERVRKAPGYPAYIAALRGLLTFPLTVYRVTTAAVYEEWRSGSFNRPIATTLDLGLANLVKETFPPEEGPAVLVQGNVSEPEAVVMRGRIEGYEIVIDAGRVTPVEAVIVG